MKMFKLVYLNHDNKTFGISAWMSDDTGDNERITDLQYKGHNITVFSTEEKDNQVIVREWTNKGYLYREGGLI